MHRLQTVTVQTLSANFTVFCVQNEIIPTKINNFLIIYFLIFFLQAKVDKRVIFNEKITFELKFNLNLIFFLHFDVSLKKIGEKLLACIIRFFDKTLPNFYFFVKKKWVDVVKLFETRQILEKENI